MKFWKSTLAVLFFVFIGYITFVFVYTPDKIVLTETEYAILTDKKEVAAGTNDTHYITTKLFGFIPIKRVAVDILPFDNVIVGGVSIGLVGNIENEEDEKISGVGILSFINPQNNNFSALGHQMTDFDNNKQVNLSGGSVYAVETIGIEKTNNKKTGVIKSILKSSEKPEGSIKKGTKFGVSGCLYADSEFLTRLSQNLPISTRYNVKSGKAILRTSLDNNKIEDVECQIIKTRYQSRKADKSMVIRITDKDFLERTGGILHGMSGSPIIQNGHLVGILTHATTHDPAKGYAVYIDFAEI
ncbi:MAG: hypothetical protein LBH47_00005 [Christensenellaceae bacterium]|jgi:hypothetical protein|nr:hypothetical protein [Christensenellaceae bacterium]